MTISNGSSCAIICNVTGPSTEDLQMRWQRVDGLPLTGQVTQLSKTQLQLFMESVTDSVYYQCTANNSMGINAVVTKIDVASCLPDSPSITSLGCSNDTIHITWSSGERNVNLSSAFIVEVNKVIYKVSSSTRSLKVHSCKDSFVSVIAENGCGKSMPVIGTIYTTKSSCKLVIINECELYIIILATNTTTNPHDQAIIAHDQGIIIGLAVMFVLTTSILTIIVLISWRKINQLKKEQMF